MSSSLNVRLQQYEGPLDLLLDLIRKQELDIRDIPIALITAQYLEYVEQARALDIDLGAEFIYMAATLIHIKSKTLLPRDPELERISPEEDPRSELVDRLLEHERFKNAAEMLHQKRIIEENVWSNPQIKQYLEEEEDPGLKVTLFDLVKVFGEIVERARNRPVYEIEGDDVSIPDMIRHLGSLLRAAKENEPVLIVPLLERQRSVRAIIAMFLAVLELVKRQAVTLSQNSLFGEIELKKHKAFEQVLADTPFEEAETDYT